MTRATLSGMTDFHQCLNPACTSGQIHPDGEMEPIFTCNECGHQHCVLCNRNWHPGVLCDGSLAFEGDDIEDGDDADRQQQEQERIERERIFKQRMAEEEASTKRVSAISKPCPECGVNIDKYEGCDHVTCSYWRLIFPQMRLLT